MDKYFSIFPLFLTSLSIISSLFLNQKLWDIEENIRIKEKNEEFDFEFIELARSVYKTNTIRFKHKTEVNTFTKSYLIEEKSH